MSPYPLHSPSSDQRLLIKNIVRMNQPLFDARINESCLLKEEEKKKKRVFVHTIGEVQGSEADYVLVSMVRNDWSKLGFLQDKHIVIGLDR